MWLFTKRGPHKQYSIYGTEYPLPLWFTWDVDKASFKCNLMFVEDKKNKFFNFKWGRNPFVIGIQKGFLCLLYNPPPSLIFQFLSYILWRKENKRSMGHIAHLTTSSNQHDKIRPQCGLKGKKDIIFSLKTEWSLFI